MAHYGVRMDLAAVAPKVRHCLWCNETLTHPLQRQFCNDACESAFARLMRKPVLGNEMCNDKQSALEVQISGDHYKKYPIQPVEYIHKNKIPFIEGNIIKYVTRHRDKNGVEDLKKARHFIDLLIELESA